MPLGLAEQRFGRSWRSRGHDTHRKGRLFFHYILCEVHPSTELIIRVGWSLSFSDPAGGRPGATATRPLGEMGCFWTTFLGFDPSKLGISPSKKRPRYIRAIFPTRLRFLHEPHFCPPDFPRVICFFGGAPCCWTCAEARTTTTTSNNNKQQQA